MEILKFVMVSSHYPPYHLGGDAVMVEYLSNELNRRGHEVHVLYSPSVYELIRKDKSRNVTVQNEREPQRHEFRPRRPRQSLVSTLITGSCRRAEHMLHELCQKVKPDVVHWHNTRGFISQPHPVEGAVSLYTAHDYYTVCPRSNLTRPDLSYCTEPGMCAVCSLRWGKPPQVWRMGGKRVLRLDEHLGVICPSEFMAGRLRRDGIHVDSVLRNFVPDPGPNPCENNRTRALLLYVGMLELHKGPQTLLEAFVGSSKAQGFDLAIVGNGSQRERLVESATRSKLGSRIVIPGFVSRESLRTMLCKTAALVVPSEWPENAPLVVLEALSMGVPVIGSDQGGLPEVLTHESGCSVYRSGDLSALSDALISCWEERSVLDDLGRKARDSYQIRFSPETHLKGYFKIIENVHG